jgi:hypothetical protein
VAVNETQGLYMPEAKDLRAPTMQMTAVGLVGE